MIFTKMQVKKSIIGNSKEIFPIYFEKETFRIIPHELAETRKDGGKETESAFLLTNTAQEGILGIDQ